MKASSAVNAWADINSLLRTHKLINVGLICISMLQVLIIGLMYFADPIVVVKEGSTESYHSSSRRYLPISEGAVENFVIRFLKKRYEWKNLDPNTMRKNLSPIVTEGLKKRLYNFLVHLKEKEFQGKETSQSIVNIEIKVTESHVISSFDKLLKIEGIPIPIPTTISLNIIKGVPNAWNPIGLRVNGVKEHQSK